MQDPLLRKEPKLTPRDDIPVLNDLINVSWDRLSQVLTRVPKTPQAVAAASGLNALAGSTVPTASATVSVEELEAVSERIIEAVSQQMDDVVDMALANSYQRMRNDLSNQMRALISECVREEIQNILQSSHRSSMS